METSSGDVPIPYADARFLIVDAKEEVLTRVFANVDRVGTLPVLSALCKGRSGEVKVEAMLVRDGCLVREPLLEADDVLRALSP